MKTKTMYRIFIFNISSSKNINADDLFEKGINSRLVRLATQAKTGDSSNSESTAAQVYWQLLFCCLFTAIVKQGVAN